MERIGSPFARFMRALRMGLGNRHADPIVAEALALFGKRFRHLDMNGLLEIARKLRSLFGWDASLAESFGGHEIGPGEEREHAIFGENLDDPEVQREVERVTDPERVASDRAGPGGGRLWINVSGAPDFERIQEIKPLDRDPAAHRRIAVEVARHSKKLRRFLHDLGLARVPASRRLRGTRVDQNELERLVLRGDPRVLIRRELAAASDLFIGVAVDCSGSMASGQSMDKAKRFAVLLAEAARGLPRVDLRVFGFTDRVIYDAGDAARSAASSLFSSGGNNDAAGLLHVAEVGKKSQRTARLLVMVSDGLPTECSTEALKGLVDRLERRERMCVAQVAVRPLEEVCFRHYVLLEEGNLDRAVGQFGRTVARLVRRALA
jgi:Mg-chelatase subunit ChlD